MKKLILLSLLWFQVLLLFAQQETFDIITYTLPQDPAGGRWKKEITGNITSFTVINKKTNSWCRIGIIKSTRSKGSIEQDFDSEWEGLIIKNYNPPGAPQVNETQEADGWKIKAGAAAFTFNNGDAMAMLTTMSGFNRCASIVATTNSQEFIKDIEALLASVRLTKPEPGTAVIDDTNPVIGTWGKKGSVNPSYHDAYATSIAGYSTDQYTFNANGTYHFVSKTFGMSYPKILLVKENGRYEISGTAITIIPQNSVLEAWSKKDSTDNLGRPAGGDKWGKLLSIQKRKLEKITYQFTKHYFPGIQTWNLVLQAAVTTERDGPHSSNTTFSNAWYYSPISPNNPLIELPNGQKITTEEIQKEPAPQAAMNNSPAPLGTWLSSESDNSAWRVNNGVMSSISRQYTFNKDGTYLFYSKTYDPLVENMLLGRESGTYKIIADHISLYPVKSTLESWSKKNGGDEWGKKINSQTQPPEKVTYTFTKKYAEIMSRWELVLQTQNETKRDGHFSSNDVFTNAYYYSAVSVNNKAIVLPD
ncbi:MAG: hypothetical protein HZA79_06425 [Sphingobacteriales bacterium]|nr:hypothetical protein [Sphingobacteriales bacterium]